jgi:hypothetical protein
LWAAPIHSSFVQIPQYSFLQIGKSIPIFGATSLKVVPFLISQCSLLHWSMHEYPLLILDCIRSFVRHVWQGSGSSENGSGSGSLGAAFFMELKTF